MPISYSSCPLDCFDGCRFQLEISNDRVLNIKADPDYQVTNGYLCPNGKRHLERLYSRERIIHPLIRTDNGYEPLSLDNALNLMAEKIAVTVKEYGSTAILNYSGAGSAGLLHNLDSRFFNALGGVTETVGSICWGSGIAAQKMDFGGLKAHDWDDLLNSKLIVLWGRDPHTTNKHLVPYLNSARKQGCRLLVINPLLIKASDQADLVLRPRPGTDGVLAMAMGRVIIEEGWYDQEFVNKYTTNFDEYLNLVNQVSLAEAAAVTGLSVEEIMAAASLYAQNKPGAILFGYGLQRYANSGHTVRCIDALAALTGNLGVAGGGANYAHQVWKTDLNSVEGKHMARQERVLPMPTLASAILDADEPPIQIININRANPVNQHPNSGLMVKALQKTPMIIVTDMFMTDTARQADLIFPCTSFLEEVNLIKRSWNYYLHYHSALVAPPGECIPDYEIYLRLASMLGLPGFEYQHPDEWISWIIAPLTQKYGLTLEALKAKPWQHPEAKVIPWQEGCFATDDSKYHFVTEGRLKPHHNPDDKYPWRLLTIHRSNYMHSQGCETDQEMVKVEIGAEDSERVGIKSGQMVLVETPVGKMQGRAVINPRILPGVVVIEQGGWVSRGSGVNLLTGEVESDMGYGTPLYDCCCRIEAF